MMNWLVVYLLYTLTTNICSDFFDEGWIVVDHYSDIDFDLENTPLEIKSDSAVGSEDQIYVAFQTAQDGIAGGINIILASPPQYNLEYCSESMSYTDLTTAIPSETNKIWRITLLRASAKRRVLVHCNEVEVLDIELSDSVCSDSNWRQYWSRDVKKINFSVDSASDFYRSPISGWKAVELSTKIVFDLENTPLEIKTESALGSNEVMKVRFISADEVNAGGIFLNFSSTPIFRIFKCKSFTLSPTDFPTETDKIWRITLSRTSGNKHLVVHCNEREVLNYALSQTRCDDTDWSTTWGKDVAIIRFSQNDSASVQYKTQPGSVTCSELSIPDVQVLPTGEAAENTVVTVTCLLPSPYMNLIGDKEVTCQSTGWKTASGTMPECIKSGKH